MSHILVQNLPYGAERHGGTARTKQVVEFLSGIAELHEVPVAPVRGRRSVSEAAQLWGNAPRFARHFATPTGLPDLAMGARVAAQVPAVRAALARWGAPKWFVTEHVSMAVGVKDMLRARGCRIVGVHQNIDSFNAELPKSERARHIYRELELFRMCDLVLSLALEDAWLFRNLDIPAQFLPYVTAPDRIEELHALGRRRLTGPRDIDLVLGSATNYITREGTADLLRFLRAQGTPLRRPLVVVGGGTEVLRAEFTSPRIEIRGRVDDPELQELLVRANSLVVHQLRGSGALIRIADTSWTGINVYASRHAARSAPPLPNVQVGETLRELAALITREHQPLHGPQEVPLEWREALASARKTFTELGASNP